MADVFPRRDLPGTADVWGREVEKRTSSNELSLEMLGQAAQAQNRNTASSLSLLAASIQTLESQVLDLSGRVSYSASNTTTQSWTSSVTTPFAWGPSISFTLDSPRVISCQTFLTMSVEARTNNATSATFVSSQGIIFANGSAVTGARGRLGVIAQVRPDPAGQYQYAESTVSSRSLISLPAGTHTIQGGFDWHNINVVGSGSGTITASNPNLFIDVLQISA